MRERCFSELILEVDKMAGLRLSATPQRGIKHWDQQSGYELLPGEIETESGFYWHGELLSPEIIEHIMGETHQGARPKPYRLRTGALGKPKSVAALRFNSTDGEMFNLDLIDLRQQSERLMTILSLVTKTRTTLKLAGIGRVLFDPQRDENKLKRLGKRF